MKLLKNTQSGRSMVEMLGVLAIIGVLSVGGIAGYSKAMSKYKFNKLTDDITMLIANIRTTFSAQGNYKGLTSEKAIQLGIVPDSMIIERSNGMKELVSPYADVEGLIQYSDLRTDGDAGAFIILINSVPREDCVALATADWGSNEGSGLVAIGVGADSDIQTVMDIFYIDDPLETQPDTEYSFAKPGSANYPTPMKIADAAAVCAEKYRGVDKNTIIWKYY